MGQFPNDYNERGLSNLDGTEKIFLDDSGTAWVKLSSVKDFGDELQPVTYSGDRTLVETDRSKKLISTGADDHSIVIPTKHGNSRLNELHREILQGCN